MKEVLELYKHAHKWLIIPIVIIFIAFTPQYFRTFFSEPWGYHLHALSAIAWYVLIMIQPYLATHGKIKAHRFWGMVALFIAGGVVFSALSITPTNIYFGQIGGFEPVFPAAFFYGLTFTETLAIMGFGVAVIMAIKNSKKPDEHAIWMISTVFFGLMPAWGRLAMFPSLMSGSTDVDITRVMMIAVPIFLSILAFVAYKLNKLTHPAIILAGLVNVTMLFIIPIGSSTWFQNFITALMQPTVPWP